MHVSPKKVNSSRDFELESSPEYARMMSEVGRNLPAGGHSAIMATGTAGDVQSSHQPATLSTPLDSSCPSAGENNNEEDDFINKVCKFEMISRKKSSPSSSTSSPTAKSPTSPTTSVGKSPTSGKTFFSSEGGGWKGGGSGGGRGSGTSTGSGGGGGPNPTIPLVSPFSPQGFIGEKVFTRDTATTRVSASLLQNLVSPTALNAPGSSTVSAGGRTSQIQQQRVQSSESNSTQSSSSFTSVSTLSWTSDRSDPGSGLSKSGRHSKKRRGSGGEGVKAAETNSVTSTDVMTSSDPCVFPSSGNNTQREDGREDIPSAVEDIIYDDVPTPIPSPRVLPAHITSKADAAKHRGGVFDMVPSPSSSSVEPVFFQHNDQTDNATRRTPSREGPKKFVTLSTSDRDSFPSPVVKQLPSTPTSFPYITPVSSSSTAAKSPSPSSSSSEHMSFLANGDVSGSSSSHLLPFSANTSGNRDSVRSGSSTGSGGHAGSAKTSSSSSASSHRNTFEGMDFEFQDLTSQQQQLALRHREIVAERKREQERERMDRQRLEDILKMCEEYQNEVELSNPASSSTVTASFSGNGPVNSSRTPPTSATLGFTSALASHQSQAHQSPKQASPSGQKHQDQNSQHTPEDSYKRYPPPPYSHVAPDGQPPPPYSPRTVHTPLSGSRPPGQLDLSQSAASSPTSSIDRKDRGMNKIKTNGSLMLGSPNNPYKEFPTQFSYPQVSASASLSAAKPAESSSTYSSNSEDETVGSSEETGTIKKRPGMGDGISAIVGGNLSRQAVHTDHNTSVPLTLSSSPHSSPKPSHPHRHREAADRSDGRGAGAGAVRNGTVTMRADISDGNIVITTTKDFYDSSSSLHTHPSKDDWAAGQRSGPSARDTDQGGQACNLRNVTASDQRSSASSSSSSSSPTTSTTNSTPAATKEQPSASKETQGLHHQSSTSSSSSSHTIRKSNCSSSGGSTPSLTELNVAMEASCVGKEDTPTPVNSDSEQVDTVTPRAPAPLSPKGLAGPDLSPLLSILVGVTSSGVPLSPKEECQFKGQLEGLKLTRTQLLVRTAELRRQIAEIELQESEAVRELDLETKLLEGEHREQMSQLQQEQEKLSDMKRRQQETLDMALREREKEQRIINLERQKLLALEEQQHAIHERLLRSAGSTSSQDTVTGSPSSPSSPTSSVSSGIGGLPSPSQGRQLDTEELTARRLRLQHELERQRRIFDDLEFQQLEAEARFESEREQINSRLLAQQAELLQKYKEREERLQQIDIQQKYMVSAVKESLESFKRQRLELAEAYKKEKSKITHCDKKIAELCRVLSLPPPVQREDSDDDLADLVEGNTLISPSPNEHQLFVDADGTSTELRKPLDLSLDSSTGSGGGVSTSGGGGVDSEGQQGPQRKKSTTLLEIERNRSLFIEQQVDKCIQLGSMIIDQERKRIEELRRRAADEGRAQWEERRRAADESVRLQAEERQAREANCKSFNSVESEDSSIASSCDTPSEKETSSRFFSPMSKVLLVIPSLLTLSNIVVEFRLMLSQVACPVFSSAVKYVNKECRGRRDW
ncbi:pleckstrin-like protein domain family b member 2 [Plakobranchus ocellatus]|uniref:Pleckstrin-like protein domain family b member 2 n=1 Tax=Plakobranchus ocellatus TaxID=259542 RepID=A0AAV4DQL9_9GAST|nr:pleckstrin-like protein domain family b member 2 [Plakobranchus ocellatus]